MAGDERFLQRWSRRKLDAATEPHAPAKPEEAKGKVESEAAEPAARTENAPFERDTLPPVDAIDANSDIGAFLAPNVPADLTRAALRRAWSTDPAIRDFIGLSENAGDFNAPGAMSGFGPISADEIQRLVARLADTPDAVPPAEGPSDDAVAVGHDTVAPQAAAPAAIADCDAEPSSVRLSQQGAPTEGSAQSDPPDDTPASRSRDSVVAESPSTPRPRHGGALPR